MEMTIPELSVVVLIGTSGSGKSTFAGRHFKPTEILSSDYCRALAADDETDQTVTQEAFDILQYIAKKRLGLGKCVVIDATNVRSEDRKSYVKLAREFHCIPVCIVFDIPEKICQQRNEARNNRNFGSHVIRNQKQNLKHSLRHLKKEGFRYVYVLNSEEEINAVTVKRSPLWTNLKHESGPFDVIGDIHGCYEELLDLLNQLGYVLTQFLEHKAYSVYHPQGRRVVFLGDLVDRGPATPEVLRLVMAMVESGIAFAVPGNHDLKLLKKLRGQDVRVAHGLAESLDQLKEENEEFIQKIISFLDGLISHYAMDNANLVVAHAGMREELQGRGSAKVRSFALYGETTGETDQFGLPVRYNWAADYRGKAMVVYGHSPVPEAKWLNKTINIDTGCVFGGKLTALRYPEKELLAVASKKTYYESVKPFLKTDDTPDPDKREYVDLLDINDVLGKRTIETSLEINVTIRKENTMAALEVMSRFAIDPRSLIYLPPTMSPSETSKRQEYLEYPEEAFAYYRKNGIDQVICQEKHMGSRAVIILCQDEETAVHKFGLAAQHCGICYTRTGRAFFKDAAIEKQLLKYLRQTITNAGLWEEFNSQWFAFDCEIMPWSEKAQQLIKQQYAAVAAAASAGLTDSVSALKKAAKRGIEVQTYLNQVEERLNCARQFSKVYKQYCWPVYSIFDLKIAPFQLLASEGRIHMNKDHLWHMNLIKRLAELDQSANPNRSVWMATSYKIVESANSQTEENAIQWWEELTTAGAEGMVVKPLKFILKNKDKLIQPAIKCRGREYLRIIYGLEYTMPEHLDVLRNRGLGKKRSLAIREFALGMEALQRFVKNEPLYRIHEAIFGILALESEPVDPRL